MNAKNVIKIIAITAITISTRLRTADIEEIECYTRLHTTNIIRITSPNKEEAIVLKYHPSYKQREAQISEFDRQVATTQTKEHEPDDEPDMVIIHTTNALHPKREITPPSKSPKLPWLGSLWSKRGQLLSEQARRN